MNTAPPAMQVTPLRADAHEARTSAALAVCFLLWAVLFIARSSFIAVDGNRWFCLFDDAMISMRYAWNLAHGDGLVWNAGERIEGISNLLMTLLMACFARLFDRSAAVLCVQGAGVAVILAICVLCRRLGFALLDVGSERSLLPAICFALGAAFYPLSYWSLMGMETGLLSLLLVLAVWLALLRPERQALLGCVLGLAFLTRPDAAIPALLILAWRMLVERRPIAIPSSLLLATIAGTTIFRLGYYGSALPNTFLLKATGMSLLVRLRDGIGFIAPALLAQALPLTLAFIGCLRARKLRLLLGLHLAAIAYQIWIGGDPWPYWRMLAPTAPLLLLCSLAGALRLVERVGKVPNWRRIATGAALALLCLGTINAGFFREALLIDEPYQTETNRTQVTTAILLSMICRPTASVAVLYAGTIPYYTGLRAIDLLGKSDRHIAGMPADISGAVSWAGMKSVPGHNKYDLRYSIIELKPTYVQAGSWGRDDVTPFVDAHYALIQAQGVSLNLLRDSPDVAWELIRKPAAAAAPGSAR